MRLKIIFLETEWSKAIFTMMGFFLFYIFFRVVKMIKLKIYVAIGMIIDCKLNTDNISLFLSFALQNHRVMITY